jgi:sulfite dehydrogenase (cytochrome) subunit B
MNQRHEPMTHIARWRDGSSRRAHPPQRLQPLGPTAGPELWKRVRHPPTALRTGSGWSLRASARCARHFSLLLVVYFAALTARGDDQFVLPPETATLKAGAGVELANARCMICHSADYISTQPRLAAPAWKNVVVKMQQKFGAPIAPGEVDALVDYLAKNYGAAAR